MRAGRYRLLVVLLVLLGLHFYLRPRLWSEHLAAAAPDFLLVALMLFAIRARPGNAALAGFVIGLIGDALVPARFGSSALAHTVVGYLAAWGRAVFFADNVVVNGALIAVGLWLRNLIVLLAGGTGSDELVASLALWSPAQALITALGGVAVLVVFRSWLDIRLEE
ncbi:MAG TPA: rod shape-determining protein MreD [Gemmatimonadales bacterium]|nr:rod shape-determining protein MreD [Gemmatimonadales bacterium]